MRLHDYAYDGHGRPLRIVVRHRSAQGGSTSARPTVCRLTWRVVKQQMITSNVLKGVTGADC